MIWIWFWLAGFLPSVVFGAHVVTTELARGNTFRRPRQSAILFAAIWPIWVAPFAIISLWALSAPAFRPPSRPDPDGLISIRQLDALLSRMGSGSRSVN